MEEKLGGHGNPKKSVAEIGNLAYFFLAKY